MKLTLANSLLFFLLFATTNSCTKERHNPVFPILEDTLGTGWKKITLADTLLLEDVFFINDLTGYICGNKYLAKSIDGGLTWNKFNLPDTIGDAFINIFFIDVNNGWVAGDNFILRTTNGGNSWQKIRANASRGG